MVAFGTKVEIDTVAECTRRHRTRRPPQSIDDNPDIMAEISFQEFYRKEMCLVLDSLILEYADNIKVCIDQIRPLGESLQLPLTIPKHNDLLVLACEKHLTNKIDLKAVLKIWTGVKMHKLPLK